MVVQPGGNAPLALARIITDLSSAGKRTLRLVKQDNPLSFCNPDSPQSDFANLTRLELDAISFETIRRLADVFPSLTCRVVLRCKFEELDPALSSPPPNPAPPLPSKFEIWVHSDTLHPLSPWSTPVNGRLPAVVRAAPHLSALTLPLNLGIGRAPAQIAATRAQIYEFLKQFVRTKVLIQFHNKPPNADEIMYSAFKPLDEFDGEGYFSDLVAGKVDDPELRDFRVVVV